MKKIHNKDLAVGMDVVLLNAPKKCPLSKMSGIPLTVKAVEYPFVVFESEREVVAMSVFSIHSTGKREAVRTTVNVKKCKFGQVSEEYVNSIRKGVTEKESEFLDTI